MVWGKSLQDDIFAPQCPTLRCAHVCLMLTQYHFGNTNVHIIAHVFLEQGNPHLRNWLHQGLVIYIDILQDWIAMNTCMMQ